MVWGTSKDLSKNLVFTRNSCFSLSSYLRLSASWTIFLLRGPKIGILTWAESRLEDWFYLTNFEICSTGFFLRSCLFSVSSDPIELAADREALSIFSLSACFLVIKDEYPLSTVAPPIAKSVFSYFLSSVLATFDLKNVKSLLGANSYLLIYRSRSGKNYWD